MIDTQKVQIEIDGKSFEAEKGSMIIQVADEAGISIPRFCYHKKLSVVANCRMCLVEVEKAPKALPACATPVMEGMRVFTASQIAIDAQKSVMEFLLINHPLDCPICDQGGECELQDVSMGYGDDVSRFAEGKRAVEDEDLGPLISTEMTRCIHCTRCVRFGEEIAGLRELGAVFRGEDMSIGTYVGQSLTSELSGNIIDLCPVGALTSKPYRFTARAWEQRQFTNVSPHDCVGSNVFINTRLDKVMRVLPKDNENINECWLSDRDRFSYTGLASDKRITMPMIKRNGQWEEVDWVMALTHTATTLQKTLEAHGPEQFAALLSPSTHLETAYLTQKWLRALGVNNLEHRITQTDFHDQMQQPLAPVSDCKLAELEQQNTILLIGSNIQKQQPLAGLKVRKAFLNGANIMAINSIDHSFYFDLTEKSIVSPQRWVDELAAIVKVASKGKTPEGCEALFKYVEVSAAAEKMATHLLEADASTIIVGSDALNHPQASVLRFLVNALNKLCQSKRIWLTAGANSVGLNLMGFLPHRSLGGKPVTDTGLHARDMFEAPRKAYLFMDIEPELDTASQAKALSACEQAECVIYMSAFVSDAMKASADIILPIASFTETPGTMVNMEGTWQSFQAAAVPKGQARPAWKVIRVLANLFKCPDFEYETCAEVKEALKKELNQIPFSLPQANYTPNISPMPEGLTRLGSWPMYRVDALTRAAEPLQGVSGVRRAAIYMHPDAIAQLQLGETACVNQGAGDVTLPVIAESRLADNTVFIPAGFDETSTLTTLFGPVTVRASA